MNIGQLFLYDVTRDIPPVIYFHEQSPEKLAAEVGEYIVTGGWPEGHPAQRRVPSGIHEQYVRLLAGIARELDKPGGPELPASWISGFYGSGKSSFAKLLGLALDGRALPGGAPLAEAWLKRDTSPRAAELTEAWRALQGKVQPIACVFDIGGSARDNEQIHAAIVRQVQQRLGYSENPLIASFEIRLEQKKEWDAFLAAAQEELGAPWSEVKDDSFADTDFSAVLHRLKPDRYSAPESWLQTWMGEHAAQELSPGEAVGLLGHMLDTRAPGATLFVVVDEVSQYIHQDHQRMLRLQSFVSSLGQRLKGRAWLLVTGQEQLEAQNEASVLGRLKDRFPPALRVHLSPTNIRDVVHKRLLQKHPSQEATLRDLFQRHRQNLQLYAYRCADITEGDFLEVYPLLPEHIELLMQITSALRAHSQRRQGDDHAIRGLIQLLGELFREQRLAEAAVGSLVTLDAIFEVYQSSLDYSTQGILRRIFEHCTQEDDVLAARAAKAVALLQLISEEVPTTAELVAQCLYARLDQGDQRKPVTEALERLREANLLGFSDKRGYKLRSSAGEEWDSERSRISVPSARLSELVQKQLELLVERPEPPRLQGVPFPLEVRFTDSHGAADALLRRSRQADSPVMTVDLRWLTGAEDPEETAWLQQSSDPLLRDRLLWIAGDTRGLQTCARELARAQMMVSRYDKVSGLSPEKQHLLIEEKGRVDEQTDKLQRETGAAWMAGTMYFRGRKLRPDDLGGAFATALQAATARALPEIYPHFNNTLVKKEELKRLLGASLDGLDSKFQALGILSLDAGRTVATCHGEVPSAVLRYIQASRLTGGDLFTHFLSPPYGYNEWLVRACLAGLLWAGKLRILPEQGAPITSARDPDVLRTFEDSRPLRRAEILAVREEEGVSPRDRNRICQFFQDRLGVTVDRQNDAIADAVYQTFPGRTKVLQRVEERLKKAPFPVALPESLAKLRAALEACRASRQVEPTVAAVRDHLDVLGDGLDALARLDGELTDERMRALTVACELRRDEISQLRELDVLDEPAAAARIEAAVDAAPPWAALPEVAADVERVKGAYQQARQALLDKIHAEAEDARNALKLVEGFEKLNAAASNQVLHTITAVVPDTTAQTSRPRLRELRDRFAADLRDAIEEARATLDDLLSRLEKRAVVDVKMPVRNRIISEPAEFDALVAELRELVLARLQKNERVRLNLF